MPEHSQFDGPKCRDTTTLA